MNIRQLQVIVKKGEYILKFEGQIISFEQTATKGELEGNTLQIDYGAYIDVKEPGVYINYSCNPNSDIVKNSILIAIEDILAGEEVCFDYSTTMMENHWTMVCKCDSKNCRGIIKDFHLLPEDVKKRYLQLRIVQEFIEKKRKGDRFIFSNIF